ncbi:MAG: phage baseplate assembly protein V [Synechococcales bacterium]|nr:phage baseplate assembly protein V [Synechococcales bacterium]
MSQIIQLIQRMIQQELAQQRTSLLGVITQIFPHTAADDDHNYEATVRLKHEDLELPKVPIAVTQMGLAGSPKVGDLVLVQFINGDLNQPVITGRFYHADQPPPLHNAGDMLYEHEDSNGKFNQLRFNADGTIYLQKEVTKREDNSEAKTSIKIDGSSGDLEIKAGEITITITNDTDIKIVASGKPIEVTCDTFKVTCDGGGTIAGDLKVDGNVNVNGDLKVSGAAGSTTISGNEITGA